MASPDRVHRGRRADDGQRERNGVRRGQTTPQLAAPSVDGDYLYGQLYAMAKAYSYRISGADGDPRSPGDPFNLPPTVNGWQELFAY